MNVENVESYLRNNHDRRLLHAYRSAKKFYLRVQFVRLDIYFLRSCQSKDLIPKFLWFKTANRNLASSSAYKASQRRLLKAEISYKYQHLKNVKKEHQSSMNSLQQYSSEDLFENLQQIINTVCCPLIKSKEETVRRKLHGLSSRNYPKHAVDPKVVKNLSARVLSDDEIDCLAHGLDYGLIPRYFDDMSAVGNIEQFFHRITDVFQHQKKLMTDLKDKDKIIPDDIRVLNTKEMTLASNLRSVTDTFRFQANQYRKQQNAIREEQQQYHQLLKELRQDKSIIITRPDKGRGIVLMDKKEYLSKMNLVLNDPTKFACLFDDPTVQREKSLTILLLRLKKQGQISDEFYYMAKPTGSNPGRLYGLPKIHKEGDIPLRPVLSSIGTFNYGLAKVLKRMLSSMVKNEVVIKDSFSFVNELKTLCKCLTNCKMVSFDIVSLYTNIPIDETIEIILKHLYNNETSSPSIKRQDMKKLLDFATKKSHFLFNGKVYDQIDGVSMGSPLAPLLAEIFLQEFEKTHLPAFKEMGIIHWKRYVDDTFVLLDPKVSPDDICARLSSCHPSLKFTVDKTYTTEFTTPFLDVLVQRQPNNGFQTTIYRKPTFSGLITKWDSFVPKSYKYNAISSMVYRAVKICSSNSALHDEFEIIRNVASSNGYPTAFVESIIRRQLNLIYEPRAVEPKTPETETIVLRIPYYGKPSEIYGKRVMAAVAKQYPLKKIRVVYDVKARIGQNFTIKDQIPTDLKSGVVYEATCSKCNDCYIGKTCRHLKTRIDEHLSEQKKILSRLSPSNDIEKDQNSSSVNTNGNPHEHTSTVTNARMINHTINQRTRLPKPKILTSDNTKPNQTPKAIAVPMKLHMTRSKTKKPIKIERNLEKDDIDQILANVQIVNKTEDVAKFKLLPVLKKLLISDF